MATVKDWNKEIFYHDPPLQDRDQIYLKCYKGGEAGYVGRYEDRTPGSTIVTIMNGISTSRSTESSSIYYATWVPAAKKDTEAFQFIVHRDGGEIWFESDILGGHQEIPREMICIDQDPWVYYEAVGRSNKATFLKFSGAGHMGFVNKYYSVYASKYSEATYLNTKQSGEECVFVPEKVTK
ncbi:MAG: hypothetical protein Q9167_000572 [Letrouitia subvulpina]